MPKQKNSAHLQNYDKEFPWVEPVLSDKYSALRSLCRVTISLRTMGRCALESHAKGKKHIQRIQTQHLLPIFYNFSKTTSQDTLASTSIACDGSIVDSTKSNTLSESTRDTIVLSTSNSAICNNNCPLHCTLASNTVNMNILPKPTNVQSFLLNEEVTKAEIIWCLNGVLRHSSLRDIESYVSITKAALPDSLIGRRMQLSKAKVSYMIVYGLSSYFLSELKSLLSECSMVVFGFDECFNKFSQKQQMDLSVRFWDNKLNEVSTRYFTSCFLGHTTANDLLQAFQSNIPTYLQNKLIQVSMDGPNVNISFFRKLQADFKENRETEGRQLLDAGSCGLHVVHGGFKTGIKSTGWKLAEFLRSCYNLFKNVPAGRADYYNASNSIVFPEKFCPSRWLENLPVAERFRIILPYLQKYVEKVTKENRVPDFQSFKIVAEKLKDKLLVAKLSFFESFANDLQRFLTEFQSNEPLIPFLFNELLLCKNLLSQIVKKDVLEKTEISKINLKKSETLLRAKDVKLGYATKHALRPLKYAIVKAVAFLDPVVAIGNDIAEKRLSKALELYVPNGLISGKLADKVDWEFKDLCSRTGTVEKFKDFSMSRIRVDHFWTELITLYGLKKYANLFHFIKSILILSHGNAFMHSWYKEGLAKEKKDKEEVEKLKSQKRKDDEALKELEVKKKKIMNGAIKETARLDEEILQLKRY